MNTRFALGSFAGFVFLSAVFGACGPDWDALDPSLGEPTGNGGGGTANSGGAGGTAGNGGNGGAGGMPCVPNDDNNDCTIDTCVNGAPLNTNAALDAPCMQNGGSVCDGMGKCVECNVPTQCPGADSDCSARTCSAGGCGLSLTPKDTPIPNQTPDDCKTKVCDGMGAVIEISDKPGTSCGAGGVCDNMAGCVICLATDAPQTLQSTDVPKNVPNNDINGASSTLNVMGLAKAIVKVSALLNISGGPNSDFEITLISPSGTMLDLSSGNGGGLSNGYAGTLFNDGAAERITELTFASPVPSAIPERNLNRFFGEDPNGNWTLLVKDITAAGSGATINSWQLEITAADGVTVLAPMSYEANPSLNINNNQTVTSTINVPDNIGSIAKVTVEINVPHQAAGQLIINLISPQNKSIRLSTQNGAGNNNSFAGTLFDDSAPLLMGCAGAGCVTFVNNMAVPMAIPEGSLSSLIGNSMMGAWTLEVVDTANPSTGKLESWKLHISPSLCPL